MAQNNRRGRSGRRRSGGNQGNNPNRSIDSQGPEVKIRGNAQQVYDKYTALARDAFSNGDRIRAESLQQHAEHYYRTLQAMKPPEPKEGQNGHQANGQHQNGGQRRDGEASGEQNDAQDGSGQTSQDDQPRKPRRERRPRRDADADAADRPGAAKAEEPSDRPAVETMGDAPAPAAPTSEGAKAETDAEDAEAKPRRRRRTRRKTEDEGAADASGEGSKPEEAPAA